MPTKAIGSSANQVEEELHRILHLVRANKDLNIARLKTKHTKTNHSTTKSDANRHRHANLNTDVTTKSKSNRIKSLSHAKVRALTAVYGLKTTPEPNQDVTDISSLTSAKERQELLEARRRIYKHHFGGLQATYSATGRPKLETLIDAAMDAKRKSSRHSAMGIGAAILTSGNHIYASTRLEAPQFEVCAERAALLKVVEHNTTSSSPVVVEAMVICSDQHDEWLPMPCGSCREFLSEFGNFPIYLLNADNASHEAHSFDLFPHSRHTYKPAVGSNTLNTPNTPNTNQSDTLSRPTPRTQLRPLNVRDWTMDHIIQWLIDVVQLPQHVETFVSHQVDGPTLLLLTDADLQLLLGILHPLHRQRLLLHVDRLKDRELVEQGVDYQQLDQYLAVLDRDRLTVVAQLKETFDRLDGNQDGMLDRIQFQQALITLGCDPSTPLVQHLLEKETDITFTTFVEGVSSIAQLPVATVHSKLPLVDIEALRQTFNKADTNQSGGVDEKELIQLLLAMGRQDSEQTAREWFQAVDFNQDGRLSFAEFVVRYTQLTRIDISSIQRLFESGPRSFQPLKVLSQALQQLYPHIDAKEISVWCRQCPWKDKIKGDIEENEFKTIDYPSFVLACLLFHQHKEKQRQRWSFIQQTMQNGSLAHKSRIVCLQESGHVRLCPKNTDEEESIGARRRRAQQVRKVVSKEDEEKEDSEDDIDKIDKRLRAVFTRFTRAVTEENRTSPSKRYRDEEREGKENDSDEENDRKENRLNSVEVAQALLELGILCTRHQLLRYLDQQGYGLKRTIDMRSFQNVYRRLRVLTSHGLTALDETNDWCRSLRPTNRETSERPRHVIRKDYDADVRPKAHDRMVRPSRTISRTSEMKRLRKHKERSKSREEDSTTESEDDSVERHSRFRGFDVGDRVTLSSHGPATIIRLYRDYFIADLHLDTGNKLKNIELSRLRRLRQEDEVERIEFKVGQTVLVSYKGTHTKQRGVIHRCRMNQTYDVIVGTGKEQVIQERIGASQLTRLGKPIEYTVGMKVTVKRRCEYVRGTISLCRTNGLYDVKIANGKVLKDLAWELLAPDVVEQDEDEEEEEEETHRRQNKHKQEREEEKEEEESRRDQGDEKYTKGDRIEARFQGQKAYYPGKITRVYSDGSCDIAYDDGDTEIRVASRLIRPKTSKSQEYEDDFE